MIDPCISLLQQLVSIDSVFSEYGLATLW